MSKSTARIRVLAVGAMTAATLAIAVPSASAVTTSGKLTFSGAISGTLTLGVSSGCDASTNGVTLSSMTGHLSSKKFKTWSVTVFVKKPGVYNKFKFLTDSFVLDTSDFTGWVATKGTMSITATGGSVNATLAGHEGQATGSIKVKGTWKCQS